MVMTKIVYNKCYGGFGLSRKAVERYFELKGWELRVINENGWEYYVRKHSGEYFYAHELERDDPVLVRVVEEFGDKADYYDPGSDYDPGSGTTSLAIRELPSGTRYYIHEYDGYETVVTEDEFVWRTA